MAVSLLLVFLTGLVFTEEPPDVKCLVANLEQVHCMWNGSATPGVNYTFYSSFENNLEECASYVLENTTIVGCDHPYEDLIRKRFHKFTTKLKSVNRSFELTHNLQSKVKLNPPLNLSVKNGTDLKLWFYWNYSCENFCVECEARYRLKGREWKTTQVWTNYHTIDLTSNCYHYELQVKGRIGDRCGKSDSWSDWSPPVFWRSMTELCGTGPNKQRHYFPMQTTILSVVGTLIFFMLVIILVRHERIRVILIPVLPDPGKNLTKILADGNVEEWLPISKGIKEGFKANYNERACSVGEYSRVPQSPSGSSVDQSSSDHSSSSSFASLPATD